jgi:hypothetical protein
MQRIVPVVAAALLGIAIGAGVTWFVLDGQDQPHATEPQDDKRVAEAEARTHELDALLGEAKTEADDARRAKAKAEEQLGQTERDLQAANSDRDAAIAERNEAQGQADELRAEVERLKAEAKSAPATEGKLAVSFGKWGDLPAVRDADWKEIGGAAKELIPLLKELAEDIRNGKEMSPELLEKIGQQNQTLVAYWARIRKILPTNASVNGEFSHPINMANMLAAHLESAGMPLSDEQIAAIQKLGADYDSRWEKMVNAYDDSTFELQKLIDEGELKEWFKAEMLRVCTPEQRALAVPPEIDGLVGLDIYSAGVMLQVAVEDVRAPDTETLKERLKDEIATLTPMERAVLDTASFLFNDWVVTLQPQLAPRPQAQMNQYLTGEILKSARAQLKVNKELHANYAQDAEVKKRLHDSARILYPRIPQP